MSDVVEGEVVSPEEFARRFNARHALAARARVVGSDARTLARVTRHVVAHDRTRAVARNVAYIPGGMVAAARWWRENCTNAGYARDIRDAQAKSDTPSVIELRKMADVERHRRFERVMAYIAAPQKVVKGLLVLVSMGVGGLLLLGGAAALAFHDATLVTGPIRAVMWAVATIVWLFTVGGTLIVAGLGGLVILCLWAAGRRAGDVPEFLAPAEERAKRVDDEITSDLAIAAFRDLGIAELRKRIDATPSRAALFATTPHIAGCGMQFDFIPPRGATHSGAILERHDRLAENLLRLPHEVHASVPKSGIVRVWAADSGALDEPIEPSPLVLDDGIKADYRRGSAPFGVGLRSNRVGISLFQKHVLVAGMSAQGKTATMRALALWLTLDPNVELWVADLKGFNDETGLSDWEMFRGIATRFITGPTDEHVVQTVEMLEDAVTEMKRRLVEGGKGKNKPLICICDEVQVLYMSPVTDASGRHYGGSKSTSRGLTAVRELHNQGRVTNTLLWEGTQDPSNQNYPVLARNGIHLRISTAISTEPQARMVLQDKAVDAGAAPHLLRLGKDKGTVVVAGDGAPLADDEMFAHVRVHYIDDQAANEIADRAKRIRGPVKVYQPDEVRDLLQDVHEALGEDDELNVTDMPARLRELAPGYRPYRNLKGKQPLIGMLEAEGVKVKHRDGYHLVTQEFVTDELNRRQDEQ